MSSMLIAKRRRRSLKSSRICACAVASSAVVGSSNMSKARFAREGHGDHHSLALPARQPMRVRVDHRPGLGQADALEELHGRARACRRDTRFRILTASCICHPIVTRG